MATSSILRNAGGAIVPSQASLNYAKSIAGASPEYQVSLDITGDEELKKSGIFPIIANLPERYHIEFTSQWSNPFAKDFVAAAASLIPGAKGAVAGAVADIGSKVSGISTKLKSQSAQVWESSSPMSFSIDLIFVAKTNSLKDVKEKHRALLKLAAPSEKAGQVIVQPGPTIIDRVRSGRTISMQVGTYLFMDNVIINSVSSDVSTLCDANGIPQHMIVNVGISSYYACFTTQDIDNMFGINESAKAAGA